MDPSVQSAPLYNQYSFGNQQPSYGVGAGYNSPLPDQYSSASVPHSGFAPVANPLNPQSLNPSNPAHSAPINQVSHSL